MCNLAYLPKTIGTLVALATTAPTLHSAIAGVTSDLVGTGNLKAASQRISQLLSPLPAFASTELLNQAQKTEFTSSNQALDADLHQVCCPRSTRPPKWLRLIHLLPGPKQPPNYSPAKAGREPRLLQSSVFVPGRCRV